MRLKRSAFQASLAVLFFIAWFIARDYPIEAGRYPRILSILGMVTSLAAMALTLYEEWRVRKNPSTPVESVEEKEPMNKKRMVVFYAILFTYVVLIPVVGFYTCTAVYILCVICYLSRTFKLYYVFIPLIFTGLLYMVFYRFLNIMAPRGFLF